MTTQNVDSVINASTMQPTKNIPYRLSHYVDGFILSKKPISPPLNLEEKTTYKNLSYKIHRSLYSLPGSYKKASIPFKNNAIVEPPVSAKSSSTFTDKLNSSLAPCINIPFLPKTTASFVKETKKQTIPAKLYSKLLTKYCHKTVIADVIIAAFIAYFMRINQNESFTIGFSDPVLRKYSSDKNCIPFHIPLTFESQTSLTFADLLNYCMSNIFRTKRYYSKQLIDQTTSINNINHDSNISIDIVDFDQNHYAPSQKSPIVIAVDQNGLTFKLFVQKNLLSEPNFAYFINQINGHILNQLQTIVANSRLPISCLDILSATEKHQILTTWNQTETKLPKIKGIHQLFEKQVKTSLENPALTFGDKSITYNELNQKANQLAHYLRKLRVSTNSLVALSMNRGIEMVIGILGILKSGAAYLPIDPTYPAERIEFMLQDSQATTVLTQSTIAPQITKISPDKNIIQIDTNWNEISQESNKNPKCITHNNHLAYIIYTSGSTGKPKGVLVHHGGVINCALSIKNLTKASHYDRILAVTSLSFDVAALDYYLPLAVGSHIFIADEQAQKNGQKIKQLLQTHKINSMQATPGTWNMLIDSDFKGHANFKILTAGEALPSSLANKLITTGTIFNIYGPTETTIYSTFKQISNPDIITIGKPIANTKTYILDKNLKPTPIGVAGELYIGGKGLAHGYLNRQQLSQERFIENPFSKGVSSKIYKTGDLVRWLPNGDIDYLGRIDNQVKIRGFRIELDEINNQIQKFKGTDQSIVIAKTDKSGAKYLAAYLTCHNKSSFNINKLQKLLIKAMPEYMVPSVFVILDKMPLTPNKKIDRQYLVKRKDENIARFVKYEAPKTELQTKLVNMWSQILDLPQSGIGIDDNFFSIGGHSLSATKIITKINSQFQTNLTPKTIFDAPTIKQLAKAITSQSFDVNSRYAPIVLADASQPTPLSLTQHKLWLLWRMNPNNNFYTIPIGIKLTGKLNINAAQKSLASILKRHEILRTAYVEDNDKPYAKAIPASRINFPLPVTDVSNLTQAQINKLIVEEGKQAFDLTCAPLIKAKLFKHSATEHLLLVLVHHIAFDGWSLDIFEQEFGEFYNAHLANKAHKIKPLSIQYADFASWQQHNFTEDKLQPQLNYWIRQLKDTPALLMPTDFNRPNTQTFNGARHKFIIPDELKTKLEKLAASTNSTLFTILLSAFAILLNKYTSQEDIAIGAPVAARNHADVENLIGFFANTVVLRNNLAKNPTFVDLVEQNKTITAQAYANQDVPFDRIVEKLEASRDKSRNPLFQTMLVLEPEITNKTKLMGLKSEMEDIDLGYSLFDFILFLQTKSDKLDCTFEYNTDLFRPNTIARLSKHLLNLLNLILENPDLPLDQIDILATDEKDMIINKWNDTNTDLNHSNTIVSHFERQAINHPNNIAVSFENKNLTYEELNKSANKVANYLINLGIKQNDLVTICINRSLEMIIGILGILKAGAAYVPIDPEYPQSRIEHVLQDSQTSILLTQGSLISSISAITNNDKITTIALDEHWQTIAHENDNNPNLALNANNVAYVIYTSGSTGKPKGVALEHKTVTNLISWQGESGKKVSQFAAFGFDVSVQEIFYTLLNGNELHIVPYKTRKSIANLVEFVKNTKINSLFLPTSLLEYFSCEIMNDDQPHALNNLSEIIVAGEALKITKNIKDFFAHYSHIELHNHYGPSESHVVTSYTMPKDIDAWDSLPSIGKPIDNTQIYILDKNMTPVPIGVPGELYIGGLGLARHYVNKQELTAEKFITNPFNKNNRLYKTGDLAKWLPDGNIKFIDRIDGQIKLRGFRIELGEIDSVLNKHPRIKQCVTVVKKDAKDNKYIASYYTTHNDRDICTNKLRSFIKASLPDYMLPTSFVKLTEFTLTKNGKIDKKALPEPSIADIQEQKKDYTPPISNEEKILAEIWAKILNRSQIGLHENFFDLGGHSLSVIQLITKIKAQFTIKLNVRDIFNAPTIYEMANLILQKNICAPAANQSMTLADLQSPVITLKSDGAQTPLFLIHPVGGTVFWYQNLTKHLQTDRPIYGIQDPSIEIKDKLFTNLSSMATQYLKWIREVQPEGPYFLGGASFGGTLSVEIARQLQEMGEETPTIIMFDSWAAYPKHVKERDIFNKSMRKMHSALAANFSELKIDQDLDYWLDLQWHRAHILWDYKIPDISQNIVLFKARDPLVYFNYLENPYNHWKNYAKDVAVNIIPGDHETIFHEPNVKILAEHLNKHLSQIDRQNFKYATTNTKNLVKQVA